jgi:hypothetical protein
MVLLVVFPVALPLGPRIGAVPDRPSKPPAEQDSFIDRLNGYEASGWMKADGWTDGSPFDSTGSAENILFEDADMIIHLDDTTRLGEQCSSGSCQTPEFSGHDHYAAGFNPIAG